VVEWYQRAPAPEAARRQPALGAEPA